MLQLLEGNGVVMDNSKPYKSMIQKEALTRGKDIGVLECTATNMNGKASAQIKVNVVGKPSMPEDRLLVSNIHRYDNMMYNSFLIIFVFCLQN